MFRYPFCCAFFIFTTLLGENIAIKVIFSSFFTNFVAMSENKRYIELLSPAKDFESACAAVDYGADALYIGGARFGARYAASNSIEQIARVVEYAHQYGVRVHSTLNTVLYDSELEEAEQLARELIAAGVDALIVQDMAFREMNLPVELHASTQVSNTTPEGVHFLEQSGFSRVILERSLTLEEIRNIRQATSVELECFVHGAICVGYSGRCFLSRSTSNRSGNRGECSQPCRLPYDLKDERGRIIMAGKHLLSVRDMDLSQDLETLIDAGICSFKIEGRLKDTRYIKNVVSYYRQQLDVILARRKELYRPSAGESVTDFTPNPVKSFTRGASQYMLHGKHGGVASLDTPKALGEYLGRIATVTRTGLRIDSKADVSAGDGVCIINRGEIYGTNINGVQGDVIEPNRRDGVEVGAELYRNYDHRFSLQLDRSRTQRKISAVAEVRLQAEGVLLRVTDINNFSVVVERKQPLEQANDAEKMRQTLIRQVAKSGGTIFSITDVDVSGEEYFVAASVVSDMRREALEALRLKRINTPLPHRILIDTGEARYPSESISRYENVINHLSRRFYERHGVKHFEQALETMPTQGERVMVSSYCIRREIGECLKCGSKLRGELYIEHGTARYRLDFDCKRCMMSLTDCSRLDRKKTE